MLTSVEKEGFRCILSRLSDSDLQALTDTITKKRIAVFQRKEAVQAILSYSASAEELLSRKKLTKDVLFQYLQEKSIFLSPSAEKIQIILEILKFWGVSASAVRDRTNRTRNIDDDDVSRTPRGTGASLNNANSSTALPHREPVFRHAASPPQEQQFNRFSSSPRLNVGNAAAVPEPTESQKLGEAFANWFFQMLNSHNPSANLTPVDFGPHHFWPDAHLQVLNKTPGSATEDSLQGRELVAQRFLAMVKDELLLFNLNLSPDGVRGRSNAHGLVVVEACGTVHRLSECLGIFQQVFGLIRDPTQGNNWKVKWSKLAVECVQPSAVPCLEAPEQSSHFLLP